MTKAIIYAAAMDAAEHNKRQRGFSAAYPEAWDDEANDAYHAEFDRLFAIIGGPEGWMDLPSK